MRTASGTPKQPEQLEQHRHDDRAAADAEDAREDAGDDPGGDYGEHQPGELAPGGVQHQITLTLPRLQLGR
jgi:hypothetical protein